MSFSIVTTNWFRLLLPLMLLTVIYLGLDSAIRFTESNLGILSNLPFVLFLCSIVLARAFKQHQIAMVASTLIIAYWFIQTRLQSPLATGTTILELSLLTGLLPVTLALVFSYKSNTSFTKSLTRYLAVISLLVVWSYLILSHFYDGGFDNINETFLFVVSNVSKIPFILVVYSVGIVMIFAICVMNMNRTIDVAVYSTSLISGATFIFFHVPHISSMLFSLSGVLLLIYLLSASHEMAFKDQLTELPGRLALESDLKHLGKRYTIAMIDIDHFKSFNDSYGHDTGDEVLRLIARQLTCVGGGACAYRYGGEEFTVLFKGKHKQEAKVHLEKLRASIASYDLVLRDYSSRPQNSKVGIKQRSNVANGETVNVTVSIGVCDNTNEDHVKAVMKKADIALYKAKTAGRNQICLA